MGLSANEEFNVGSIRKALTDIILRRGRPNRVWNKIVPLKVRICNWRARIDRLPTKVNLIKRNLLIEDDTCALCNTTSKTNDHVFIGCQKTIEVQNNINLAELYDAHGLYTLTPPSNSIGGRTTQIEFGNKFTKSSWNVRFDEDIGRLISSRNRLELNGVEYDMLSNKMAVYLDMFRSFMKYVIVSNLNGPGVVTPYRCRESSILSFSTRTRGGKLLLVAPEMKESPRKNQYSVVERRSVISLSKSASENPHRVNEDVDEKNRP
ncbi:hypothetical protein OSB04_010619 [Centaurea solstitialis]|uniref:Reverse transcriptase zinc-binding domain-containing protein n=1 Tax=Centaurea solstitialis TaxID=347529 RepID=A0AA38T7X0_9ASTR|nr:hypothetical protein OSB04_010619 [Centaurea solstitialis]